MLKLKNIVKEYLTGDNKVQALRGVDIEFRKNEFVSVLGPSGCGKTTLLNIIGGLDKYTSGDLVINGISTKKYKNRDWDSYRNHSIGFVFQSYNLIPHQSVLSNVELALTLSGVSKSERRKRAKEALEKVGLADQIYKKPNQMSGGQMQRVAIARALVNNPDILLADEPTGALDTVTSEQVMNILKEVAKEKLVIMVTHNPELAEKYSTRIVKLLDGKIISDTMPYKQSEEEAEKEARNAAEAKKKIKKTSMSFFTALSLSLNNLMTKKARTILTAFAGSIGIIGISLILSLSNGVQEYINSVEEDTLTNYPISIEKQTIDMASFMTNMQGNMKKVEHNDQKIHTTEIMTGFINMMIKEVSTNNLEDFKRYIEENREEFNQYTTDIQYAYSTPINIYRADTENGIYQVNPGQVFSAMGMDSYMAQNTGYTTVMSTDIWQRLIDNRELLESQYEVVKGRMPESYDEVVLLVSDNYEVTDYTLYALGVRPNEELGEAFKKMMMGEDVELPPAEAYTYDELMDISFKLLVNSDYYAKENDIWVDKSEDDVYMMKKLEEALEIKIVGILKPTSDGAMSGLAGTIGYRTDLMEYLINEVNKSEIVKEQKENSDVDIFTGIAFDAGEEVVEMTMDDVYAYVSTLPPEQQAGVADSLKQMQEYGMSEQQIVEAFKDGMSAATTDATYEGNLRKIGVSDLTVPSLINIYPKDFEAKDHIEELIKRYNDGKSDEEMIRYTDYVGLIMSSVSTIINAISYILIAFVAISLIVSSIMIGIITYISVLERTKEIGILRAIGASKKDISRVFNAETLIVGFTAGALGIIVTLLMLIPINSIIESLTEISGLAVLPTKAGVILVLISMFLTLIAGLLPSRIAAKKDPVVALRTE